MNQNEIFLKNMHVIVSNFITFEAEDKWHNVAG